MSIVDCNMWMGSGGAWGYVDAPASPLGGSTEPWSDCFSG